TVDILDEAGTLLAAARVVVGQVVVDAGVVRGLFFADHDAVLDVDHPRAAAGAVGRVCRADDLVPLELIAVERLPAAVGAEVERVEVTQLGGAGPIAPPTRASGDASEEGRCPTAQKPQETTSGECGLVGHGPVLSSRRASRRCKNPSPRPPPRSGEGGERQS